MRQHYFVKTLADVASFFGVALQTVRQWRTGPDPLPGEPGRFDLAECVRWRLARERKNSTQPREGSQKEKLEEAKLALEIQKRQLLFKRLQGSLVEIETAARLFERTIAEHNAQATELRDRLLMLLPDGLADGERRRFLAGVDKAVEDLRAHLANAALEWAAQTALEE